MFAISACRSVHPLKHVKTIGEIAWSWKKRRPINYYDDDDNDDDDDDDDD